MIFNKVQKIIVEHLGVDSNEVYPETSLRNELDMDDVDVVELIMQIEEELDVEIPYDGVDTIETVQNLVDCIKDKM